MPLGSGIRAMRADWSTPEHWRRPRRLPAFEARRTTANGASATIVDNLRYTRYSSAVPRVMRIHALAH